MRRMLNPLVRHRRRCDRKSPCDRCTRLGAAASCVYAPFQKTRPESAPRPIRAVDSDATRELAVGSDDEAPPLRSNVLSDEYLRALYLPAIRRAADQGVIRPSGACRCSKSPATGSRDIKTVLTNILESILLHDSWLSLSNMNVPVNASGAEQQGATHRGSSTLHHTEKKLDSGNEPVPYHSIFGFPL
ncbi:hypothetical protein N7468_003781 [Penicillium chermesinum]|uniref:Zn(2)-C6 fungal-type domain-containing protein n=1 Tax=Penicillium chermesinum TaxID=63820 RepID=A0A9W9P7D8_9EURO|nr:uncharacterized protein N7468_003781 [Penicillium chermesinum]KAJ5239162.1 hypothetical protein N7468_003781 [Penicillium chermesinum]